jgi:hypothetical protein
MALDAQMHQWENYGREQFSVYVEDAANQADARKSVVPLNALRRQIVDVELVSFSVSVCCVYHACWSHTSPVVCCLASMRVGPIPPLQTTNALSA